MHVTCPICGDYTGQPSSVEAHISAKTDDAHRGELGRNYRAELLPGEVADEVAESGSESDPDPDPDPEEVTDAIAVPTGSVKGASYEEEDDDGGVLKLAIGGAAAYVIYRALADDQEEVM